MLFTFFMERRMFFLILVIHFSVVAVSSLNIFTESKEPCFLPDWDVLGHTCQTK